MSDLLDTVVMFISTIVAWRETASFWVESGNAYNIQSLIAYDVDHVSNSTWNSSSPKFQDLMAEYNNLTISEKQNDYCNPELLGEAWGGHGSIIIGLWCFNVIGSATTFLSMNFEKRENYCWGRIPIYATKIVNLFFSTWPVLIIYPFTIGAIYSIDGTKCQEFFYDWGMDNSSDISTLLLPYPLDEAFSVYVDGEPGIFISYLIDISKMIIILVGLYLKFKNYLKKVGANEILNNSNNPNVLLALVSKNDVPCCIFFGAVTTLMPVFWVMWEIVCWLNREDTQGGRAVLAFAILCTCFFAIFIGLICVIMRRSSQEMS